MHCMPTVNSQFSCTMSTPLSFIDDFVKKASSSISVISESIPILSPPAKQKLAPPPSNTFEIGLIIPSLESIPGVLFPCFLVSLNGKRHNESTFPSSSLYAVSISADSSFASHFSNNLSLSNLPKDAGPVGKEVSFHILNPVSIER